MLSIHEHRYFGKDLLYITRQSSNVLYYKSTYTYMGTAAHLNASFYITSASHQSIK